MNAASPIENASFTERFGPEEGHGIFKAQPTPEEIACGAVDRLCAYDAWENPDDYDATAERIAEFMGCFVSIAAARLAGVIEK